MVWTLPTPTPAFFYLRLWTLESTISEVTNFRGCSPGGYECSPQSHRVHNRTTWWRLTSVVSVLWVSSVPVSVDVPCHRPFSVLPDRQPSRLFSPLRLAAWSSQGPSTAWHGWSLRTSLDDYGCQLQSICCPADPGRKACFYTFPKDSVPELLFSAWIYDCGSSTNVWNNRTVRNVNLWM